MSSERQWNAYYNVDGDPWAVFLYGHDHDLRTLRSITCKEEMRAACCCDHVFFAGNLNIGRWWIRDEGENAANADHPWQFCKKGDPGAIPISGARFD